jgi:hypothetical protein
MWAIKAVPLEYRWNIENGKIVRFWEDIWFGNMPLDK